MGEKLPKPVVAVFRAICGYGFGDIMRIEAFWLAGSSPNFSMPGLSVGTQFHLCCFNLREDAHGIST